MYCMDMKRMCTRAVWNDCPMYGHCYPGVDPYREDIDDQYDRIRDAERPARNVRVIRPGFSEEVQVWRFS